MTTEPLGTADANDDCRQQLDASRAFFDAIVTPSADGVVVLDGDGRICFANPAAQRFLGRPLEDLMGDLFGVPLSTVDPAEIDVPRADGSTRTAEMRVSDTTWQGRPAFLATLRDVTERKGEEERTAEAVRRRDEFLAMLSHELRNPIAAIANATRVAVAGGDVAEPLRVIERQCGHVTRLLDDLLDVSRVSRGKLELRRECVALQRIVTEAVDAVAPAAAERDHELRVRMDDEPLVVDGDPARLVQVVANLLGNAVKYTPAGGSITVTTRRAGDEVELSVVDDGPGIPPQQCEAIFEPFVQLTCPQPRDEASLGIGLALVRLLVELHGGTVEVRSSGAGSGSEFVVRMPGCDARLEEVPTAAPVVACPRRILVVEDKEDLRGMLAALLELDGHTVVAAEDGAAALRRLNTDPVDVALVDIGLPDFDGYELARRIRRGPHGADLFLVALTGYGLPEDVRRALESGFDRHLVKPVDFDELNRLLADGRRTPTAVPA